MKAFIGLIEALDLTLTNVRTVGTEILPLDRLTGRILSEDLISIVDSPSVNASLKDGYAVVSGDLSGAGAEHSITLQIVGMATAGKGAKESIGSGQAMRITTGAPLPDGADAVIAEEFCEETGDQVSCFNTAEPGRNILEKGSDIFKGDLVAKQGEKLHPSLLGLATTAGLKDAPVFRIPRVVVLATGDEIVAPGEPLPKGKLYASNMVEICSWLSMFGFSYKADIAPDMADDIRGLIGKYKNETDAIITSGGIWGSEKDLLKNILEEAGWKGIYHRVRIGPGKGIAFGLLEDKPVFCLPGGPPSNEMAFLQLALPGLMKMKGDNPSPFPVAMARLTMSVKKRDVSWTKFVHARIEKRESDYFVYPMKPKSRLQSMANKNALILIPEGCEELQEGDIVVVQLLS